MATRTAAGTAAASTAPRKTAPAGTGRKSTGTGTRASTGTRAAVSDRARTATRPSRPPAASGTDERAGSPRPASRPVTAAERATRRNSVHLQLPVVGELHLPVTKEEVAFLGGVAFLTVIGVLELPVAVLLAVGHGLAVNRHNKMIRAFGEALEEV